MVAALKPRSTHARTAALMCLLPSERGSSLCPSPLSSSKTRNRKFCRSSWVLYLHVLVEQRVPVIKLPQQRVKHRAPVPRVYIQGRSQAVQRRAAAVETQLAIWSLFAKCMSNDGVIALAIDDARPTLSGLANDLLLACYGPRFTVSIKTQVETGKG